MDISNVMEFIASNGFAIVMCVIMAYYVKYTEDKHREERQYTLDQHKKEISEVTTALNNNTLALQKLCDKLDTDKGV